MRAGGVAAAVAIVLLAGSAGLAGCTASDGTITPGGDPAGTTHARATHARATHARATHARATHRAGPTAKADADPGRAPGAAGSALRALAGIPVKGRSARTGYDRDEFGSAWKDVDRNGCDTRDDILRRDLSDITVRPRTHGCVVTAGTLADRYTGRTIAFRKAAASKVQIDHVVALENAWVTGAAQWSEDKRTHLANDPLNLLAVDGSANASKGDGDAATWLPPRRAYRCAYVARQVAVKKKYGAWMTTAEHAAIERILTTCPAEKLPAG